MKRKNNFFKEFAFLILIVSGIAFVITVLLFLGKTGFSCRIDTQILDHFGSFVGGLFGSLLTFTSTLFLIYSINKQQEEIDKINDKEAENDFYNHLIKYLELYREQSKSYVFGEGQILKAKYDNQFKYYLDHFKSRYEYYQIEDIEKESYYKNDILKKIEDEYSLTVLKEMQTKLIFIFKYVDENKFGEKYYQMLKFFILKEEFIILYFYTLLLLVEHKLKDDMDNEKFIYEFYNKMELPQYINDDFLYSIMHDRFLIN